MMSHWTPPALAALTRRGITQFTKSSHVYYRCWICPICLGTHHCDWERRRRSELTKLTPTTTVGMTHDVFYNSDPDTQGRCSVRLPLQALHLCVCDEWARVEWSGVGWPIYQVKKKTPKYLCYWPRVVTFEPTPLNIKMGSARVHIWGHAFSPPRHQTDIVTSWVRKKRPKLRPTFWFCRQGCSDPQRGSTLTINTSCYKRRFGNEQF